MSEIISITNVEPLDGFWIRASFSDGAVKEIDLSELIGRGNVAWTPPTLSPEAA